MRPYLALALGITAVSFAAVFIRLAAAPALVIAAYRLLIASVLLAPLAATRSHAELARLSWRDWQLALGSGAFLALHFATWISSLQFTSVASSVALVTTQPIWVALASLLLLRERISRVTLGALLIAIVGGVLIGGGDLTLGGNYLLGDTLALAGACGGAGYFLIGRTLRPRLSLLAYIALVYSVAAALLLAVALVTGQSLFGYSAVTYLMFCLLALGPQIVGHSSFNYALKYLSATFVTVTILAEPIGSTLLALFILREIPSPVVVMGGGLILTGIALASVGERRAVIE